MSDQIDTIRKTWAIAAAAPEESARVFYSKLFEISPQSEALFRSDLEAQGEKLMDTLGFVVDNLDDADTWMPAARDLAIRHVAYGVQADDYGSVGTALISTFETLLGEGFTAQDRQVWTDVYGALAQSMISAAYPD